MGDSGDASPAQWAIDLLTLPERPQAFYLKYMAEMLGAAGGFGIQCSMNIANRLPVHANITGHITLITVCSGTLMLLRKALEYRNNQRDASMLDYVRRHPDRFPPPPEKPLYRDVFEPWIPIR